MPKVIQVPGEGDVEFPDSMSDDQISQAIQKQSGAKAEPAGAASRFGSSLWDSTIGGIADTLKRYGWEPSQRVQQAAKNGDWHELVKEALFASTPGAAIATDIVKGSYQQAKQAVEQAKAGQYGQAAISATGAVPIVGPMVAQPVRQFMEGNVAGGLGTLTGTAAMLLGPDALKAASVPEKVALVPRIAEGMDPAEAAATQFGDDQGIPMTAATRTNNAVVRNAQKLAGSVPFAGTAAKRAVAAEQAGLVRTGAELADQAHPVATTPELAGSGVQTHLGQRIQDLSSDAKAAYDKLAAFETDPKNAQTIQTGTQTTTSPVLDAHGRPQTVTQPVTTKMGLPVDMRPVKSGLQPLYDALKNEMPIAQQQGSYGLKAIENIINGDDFAPASIADQNLSAMKAIQREATSAKARYLASKAIDQFSPAVDTAVAQAGPMATQALQSARDLWKAKMATSDTLESLRTEPVQLVNQLTAAKDAGINLLRDVQSKTPAALPAVGRAYLEGLMQKAFGEAGTAKPGTALSEWQKLGPSTKEILFKDPVLRERLDNFFTLAKKAAENPNPSGTATTAMLSTDGTLLLTHPHLAVPYMIGRAGLARMLMSQAGATALADGLRIPLRNPAAAALATSRILKLAGTDATAADQSGALTQTQAQ